MRKSHDLSQLNWTLRGWRPFRWIWISGGAVADVGPVPCRAPGSVQQALRDAGVLPDWTVGLNSRACEWVENRHWTFETDLPADWVAQPGRKILRCEGLDYQGVVQVNGKPVGEFCGTFVPCTFDLTPLLAEGANRLTLIFTGNPSDLGQLGYTSRIREWKTRFNYGWDWVPRLVQVGIWDRISLETDDGDAIEDLRVFTEFDAGSGKGCITLHGRQTIRRTAKTDICVTHAGIVVQRADFSAAATLAATLPPISVDAWHPNGNGPQPLYQVRLRLLDASGAVLDETIRTVGFKQVEWKPCAGAPQGAEPWICSVNGRDTFLQGVNWSPIRPFFADTTDAEYRQRLETYRDMGVNLLRVWGGATLERQFFYRLCDEFGLMVWQEFPLSSSGPDNWPPEDSNLIAEMKTIATGYVARRQHHVSLLLWCGGNELQGALDGGKTGGGKPVDITHPMIAAMAEVVRATDPTRRFLPTSSSGPRFGAAAEDFGKGLHHDVHGPWNHNGPMSEWRKYWDAEDALFRSETGMPGASSGRDILATCGEHPALPLDGSNPVMMHQAGWWIQWPDYLAEDGDANNLERYVAWSQARQAEALEYAARSCKRRFPACGGILIWMGHDCYPCLVNTSVLDVHGTLKPAARLLAAVFHEPCVGNDHAG